MRRDGSEIFEVVGYIPCPHCEMAIVYVKLSAVIAKNNGELMTSKHFLDANEKEIYYLDSPRMCTSCGAQSPEIMGRVENLRMVVNERWMTGHTKNKVWEMVKRHADYA